VSDLSLFLIKIGYLALLWIFVLVVAAAMRRELMPRRRRTASRKDAAPVVAAPAPTSPVAAPAAKPRKGKRGQPRTLAVTAGPLSGTTLPLTEAAITVGRAADNTMVLDDDYASSHHARLRPYDGGWVVEDLGSTNGTFLDKAKVVAPTPVPIGVPVKIGKTVLELRK
jgi:pSer/pThr/pTyr-binding forkhead associated (FHA) protein